MTGAVGLHHNALHEVEFAKGSVGDAERGQGPLGGRTVAVPTTGHEFVQPDFKSRSHDAQVMGLRAYTLAE